MGNHADRNLVGLADRRHGVFSRREAMSLGVSDTTLGNRTEAGLYERVSPGVYRIVGATPTNTQRLVSAVAAFGGLAAISHQTAAEIWNLTNRGNDSIEVVTTRWDRVRREGLTVHESLDLQPEDVVERGGVAITNPVRTVVDLGASNKWLVGDAFEEGIRRKLFTTREVEALVARVGRRGRRGVGPIRKVLKERQRWESATESVLEDRFRKLLARVGIADPVPQFELRGNRGEFVCRADFAYPDARVLIELDGVAFHSDRDSFRRDRSKQNQATMLGWTMLRYTWWDVVEESDRVCFEILSALRSPRC